jgi:hypothetical protein
MLFEVRDFNTRDLKARALKKPLGTVYPMLYTMRDSPVSGKSAYR